MINALFVLQEGGTRKFTDASRIHFGWKAVMDLYSRESKRREKGHARMVPKLREAYVICDSWTKLNVAPANNAGSIVLLYWPTVYTSVDVHCYNLCTVCRYTFYYFLIATASFD